MPYGPPYSPLYGSPVMSPFAVPWRSGIPALRAPIGVWATVAGSEIILSWSAAKEVDGYNVYQSIDGGAWTKLNATPTTDLTYTFTPTVPGEYNFRVTSVRDGVESAPSAETLTSEAMMEQVYSATLSPRISAVDGTAFVDDVAAITAYADGNHLLEIEDSGGKVLSGVIKTQGIGETLGAEINSGTLAINRLYKITATDPDYFGAGLAIGDYFTSAGTETCDADNKVQQVTAPSTSGATLVSSIFGTTQNLVSVDAGFAFNAASYTVRVKQILPGATWDNVYGLEWTKSTDSFTRLYAADSLTGGADFDSCEPWASIQRCNVADDGTVNAYYGDVGFAYDGTNGEVMVEIPKFYYRMWRTADGAKMLISPTVRNGFKVYPAFVRNGDELDYIYPSAFEGYYDSVTGMMRSIANVVPSTSDGTSDDGLSPIAAYPAGTTGFNGGDIRNCRYWAQARGTNWEQHDFLTHNALCMLAFVEYGTFDLQTAIGNGVTSKIAGSNNNAELTGQTAGYAGGTDLGNASGQIATDGLKSMSYRGVENLYGNVWKWVDGLNIKADNEPYISDHGFESDKFTSPYYALGVTLPNANGYGGDFVLNDVIDFGFLTSALGGDSNSGLFDYYYQTSGNRVAIVGGRWASGLGAGPLLWYLNHSSVGAAQYIGARSLFLPAPYNRA